MNTTIIVRFVDASDVITEAIDFVTNSLWPHAELGIDDGSQYSWIGAHAGTGVQVRPFDYCKPRRERRYALPCTDEQHAAIMASAMADVGKPYNYSDVVGLLLHYRKLNSDKSVICSQWVFEKLLAGGIQALNCLPEYSYLVTPEVLHLSPLFIGKCIYKL